MRRSACGLSGVKMNRQAKASGRLSSQEETGLERCSTPDIAAACPTQGVTMEMSRGLELLSELLRFLKVKFLATKLPMLFLIQLRVTKVVKCIASMGEVQLGIRRLLGTRHHINMLYLSLRNNGISS